MPIWACLLCVACPGCLWMSAGSFIWHMQILPLPNTCHRSAWTLKVRETRAQLPAWKLKWMMTGNTAGKLLLHLGLNGSLQNSTGIPHNPAGRVQPVLTCHCSLSMFCMCFDLFSCNDLASLELSLVVLLNPEPTYQCCLPDFLCSLQSLLISIFNQPVVIVFKLPKMWFFHSAWHGLLFFF